ncbi:MAG: glycosyltransferase, partial [Rhizobiales bacterium]|nr:glycosyltransferase [Hyphomicrobiales bacterium]
MSDPQRAGAAPAPQSATAPELTVVVPTFKERANVPLVVEKVATTLAGVNWEIIFVDDDSPDGTA